MTNWFDATVIRDDTTLQLVIDLVIEYVGLHGRPPTPRELRALLARPGL